MHALRNGCHDLLQLRGNKTPPRYPHRLLVELHQGPVPPPAFQSAPIGDRVAPMQQSQPLNLNLQLHVTPRGAPSNVAMVSISGLKLHESDSSYVRPHAHPKLSVSGSSPTLRPQHQDPLQEDYPPALQLPKSKAAGTFALSQPGPLVASRAAVSAADANHAALNPAPNSLKLPRPLQAALDRVSNSEIIHAAAHAGAAVAPLPRKKTKINLWVGGGITAASDVASAMMHPPSGVPSSSDDLAALAGVPLEWAAAQKSSNVSSYSGSAVQKLQLNVLSSVPASHTRVQVHSGIIDAAAGGSLSSLSLDPNSHPDAAHTNHIAISRPVFPPAPTADARTVAITLSRYMDRLLQKLPDSALCRALLQLRGSDKVGFMNEDMEGEDVEDVRVELRDAACEQLLKCFARDGVFTQSARDVFASLDPHDDDCGSSVSDRSGSSSQIDAVVAVETKLLVCNTVLSEVVRSCSASCVEQGLLIDRCFALARDAVADLAFDHDNRYATKLNAVLEESRGLRCRIVEMEQTSEAQDATIAELRGCIGNFEQSMKTLKTWLDLSRKEEAAAQHSLEIAKSNLQQERAVGSQLRTATNMMTTMQIELRQKMEDALKEVVHLTDEVATLQSVKSKSGMQKLVSEAGLGGMRVTDKLKNALKALAVARSDLMKITAEKAGIGEELKNLAQERDMLQEKLHNLSPKLDSLFLREKELLADLESESNARKRLAAAADEQKIVIVDLQKQLVQVMNKVGLMQRTRAKAGKADDTQAY